LIARAILDASAAVHLIQDQGYASQLAAKLEEVVVVTAPDLFCSELANSLWKYVRAGLLSSDVATARLEEGLSLVDSLVSEPLLASEALVAGIRYQHSVYDMMYAVLARRSGGMVITMDRSFSLRLREMEIESFCPLIKS
jgi:predicted nucleic acid-binding protein